MPNSKMQATRTWISDRGEIMVKEEHGIPHKVNVLVSKCLGKNELVVGVEDLKEGVS